MSGLGFHTGGTVPTHCMSLTCAVILWGTCHLYRTVQRPTCCTLFWLKNAKICRWKHFFSVWFKVGFSCTGVPTGGALTFVKMSRFRIQVCCIKSNKCLLPVRRSTSVLNCLYSTNDHQSCSESPQLRVVPPLAAPWRIYTSCVVPMTPKRTVSIQGWPVGGEISRRRPITSAS